MRGGSPPLGGMSTPIVLAGVDRGPSGGNERHEIGIRQGLDELVVVHVGAQPVDTFGVLLVTGGAGRLEDRLPAGGTDVVAVSLTFE